MTTSSEPTPSEEEPSSEELPSEEPEPRPKEPAAPVRQKTLNRLLLDTHVFLWWRAAPTKIRAETRDVISRADTVFVSVASAWEVAIKVGLGRLAIPDTMESGVLASGFEKLPITFAHTELVSGLPQHHRDPFDRMLIAQAMSEELTLATRDSQLELYDIPILWT